ncbi:MAG TPA: hypothetical protein VNJ53_10030 [Gaiellaceae bacterium]|nr:hypothetical protein [Gaiellaceae bacterium]
MRGHALTARLHRHDIATLASLGAYAALAGLLVATRLVGLDRGFWHDEIVTLREYVREGPGQILAGPYVPNNHELFSLLGWATSALVGESELALRLWSVLPFLTGALLVTAWLDLRVGRLAGLLFLYFVVVSPLLLDVTRQARGYGLAFLAMAVLVVAALEADRHARPAAVVALAGAGLVGTLTLPSFLPAFLATAGALALQARLRRRVALATAAVLVLGAAWYAPHVGSIRESAGQDLGAAIHPLGLPTAPFDQVLIPAYLGIDGGVVLFDAAWLPAILVPALLVGSSPLLRSARTALLVCSGVGATLGVVWVARMHAVPRFWTFLLVPLLVLLATGTASVLARLGTRRPAIARSVLAVPLVIVLPLAHAETIREIVQLPREAHRDAAAFVRSAVPDDVPVLAYQTHPGDTAFYLGRPVVPAQRPHEVVARLCGSSEPIVVVEQPWVFPPLAPPCASEQGVRSARFPQYARGGEIRVWIAGPR